MDDESELICLKPKVRIVDIRVLLEKKTVCLVEGIRKRKRTRQRSTNAFVVSQSIMVSQSSAELIEVACYSVALVEFRLGIRLPDTVFVRAFIIS